MNDVFSETITSENKISETDEAHNNRKKFNKPVVIGTMCGIIIVVVVFLICIITLTVNSYKTAVNKSVNVYANPTLSTVKELYPQEALEYALNAYSLFNSEAYSDVDELIEQEMLVAIQEDVRQLKETYGENFSITFNVTSAQKANTDKLAQVAYGLSENTGISENSVSEVYELTVSYEINGS